MNQSLQSIIDTFFYPRSIVVIGVSLSKINLGRIIVLNNLQRGFNGQLYGISTEDGSIENVPVYDSLDKIPETPDVAVIITPADTVTSYMESCGRKGIKQVVIETGGFSEYDSGKNTIESEILAIARKYGMRLVGPNCVGVGTADTGMMNAFGLFPREEKPSNVSIISQSGGIGNTFIRILNDNHVYWQKFASVGNKLDLDEVDFLQYFLEDEKTGVIMCYLEGFKRGREFFDAAMKAEKPIIILKSNRSEASAQIAQSHTTALSSSDDVIEAAFNQAGIIRVEGEDDLKTAALAFQLPVVAGNQVAVLSRSGGHAVITADACAKYGLNMIDFSEEYIDTLKQIYKTRVIAHQNPLDLGEIFDYTIFISIVEETLKLPDVHGIIFNHLYQASYEGESSRTFLDALGKLVKQYKKPVYVSLTSNAEEITDISKNNSFPSFSTPLQAAEAYHMSRMYNERSSKRRNRGKVVSFDVNHDSIKLIGEQCDSEGREPNTNEALDICRAAGIVPVQSALISGVKELETCGVSFPVAIKVISAEASHKSDVGGVRLNIHTADEGAGAIEEISGSLKKIMPGAKIDGFLVQSMAEPGHEFFIGGRRDPTFGPLVMAGAGGIYVEVLHDTATRLAPVTNREAYDMVRELALYPVMKGARGKAPLDSDAFVDAICRVSYLMAVTESIQEIDLNPVIVHPRGQGISIVDSRVFF